MKCTRSMALILALLAAVPVLAAASGSAPGRSHRQVADVPSGDSVYKLYCASCHGASGRGNGPVAIFLRRAPADLTQIAKRNKGTFPADQVYRVIDGRQTVSSLW